MSRQVAASDCHEASHRCVTCLPASWRKSATSLIGCRDLFEAALAEEGLSTCGVWDLTGILPSGSLCFQPFFEVYSDRGTSLVMNFYALLYRLSFEDLLEGPIEQTVLRRHPRVTIVFLMVTGTNIQHLFMKNNPHQLCAGFSVQTF